jgi:quercetin dioxygenase-like cupin family protein
MALTITETKHLKGFPSSSAAIKPERLLQNDNVAALLANVDAGQAIEPCRMSVAVLYYVIEGSGSLTVEDEQADLQTGSLALVPSGAVRSISAVEPTRVLAVQVT